MKTSLKGDRTRDAKKSASVQAVNTAVKMSRYQVRVVLCAYLILVHPVAVFSGRGERESTLAKSAEKFIKEFELLVKLILDGPVECSDEKSDPSSHRRMLTAFDAAWCSYLNSFVMWKAKDAESLEKDLVRAACQLEFSMMQKCKVTLEGDTSDLTNDMKAIQKQVSEDQKLLREKVMHLSGDAGIERMQNALSDTRSKYFQAKENGCPVGSPVAHIFSPSSPSSPPGPSPGSDSQYRRNGVDEGPSHVVCSLFKDGAPSPPLRVVGFSPPSGHSDSLSNVFGETLGVENELIVNEFVHGQQHSLADSLEVIEEDKNTIKILKQEISSKARIRIMEPLLKGPAGLEYLGKAFAKRYGPPSDALTALPLTFQWLLAKQRSGME